MRLTAVLLLLLLAGCGSPTAVESVAGRYELVTLDGQTVPNENTQSGFILLRSDGTYSHELVVALLTPREEEGDYRLDGEDLTFTPTAGNTGYAKGGEVWRGTVTGTRLVVPYDVFRERAEYQRR